LKQQGNGPIPPLQIAAGDSTRGGVLVPTEPRPGLPLLVRPSTGHLAAAAALSILVALVYGRISAGLFWGSEDYRTHLVFAEELFKMRRIVMPHFLFHLLTAGLYASHLVPSFIFAGRLVILCSYVLIALTTYYLLWGVFRNSRIGTPSILFLAGAATLLAEPITLHGMYTLGYLWPEPYQIPTATLMKPFALVSFACTVWYLFGRRRIDISLIAVFATATIAGTLSKPSFLICLLPASVLLLLLRWARGLPTSFTGLLAGLYVPGAAVLAWQFYQSFSGQSSSVAYHDSIVWAPFKVMAHYATGLLSKFLLSILFPLIVTVIHWKQARRDTMLQLAWLCFLFGAVYTYFFAEKIAWMNGNFLWSGYSAAFTLFVAAMVFWLRQIDSGTPRGRFLVRAWLCGAAIALHALVGARIDWSYFTHYGQSAL
jgi:hypothetical protein